MFHATGVTPAPASAARAFSDLPAIRQFTDVSQPRNFAELHLAAVIPEAEDVDRDFAAADLLPTRPAEDLASEMQPEVRSRGV